MDRNLVTLGTNTLDLPILSHRRKMKLESALEKNAGDVFWHARGLTKSEVEAVRSSGDENPRWYPTCDRSSDFRDNRQVP